MYLLLSNSNTYESEATHFHQFHMLALSPSPGLVRTRGGHWECNLVEGGTCFLLAVTEIVLPTKN